MDLKGKEIKRVFIYFPIAYAMDFKFPFGIYNHHAYNLIENEDEEVWELHRQDLK